MNLDPNCVHTIFEGNAIIISTINVFVKHKRQESGDRKKVKVKKEQKKVKVARQKITH